MAPATKETALERVRFCADGPLVTKLGFGGIPIQQIAAAEAVAVVRRAYGLGIRFFDTAHGYTNSEERIGQALADVRDDVFLVTKSPARDAATLRSHFELSLKRLGVGHVDLFLFHNVSREAHLSDIFDRGLLAYMREQQAAGRVRLIGISSHRAATALECVRTGEFAALQFPYNYLEDQAEPELLPLCREQGVGFIAMKPLAGGALSSPAAAVKWLLAQPDVVVIPGLMTAAEVEAAVGAAGRDLTLTDAERAAIESDRGRLTHAFCRRCGYCLPCPEGIPVNRVISLELFLNRAGWHRADAKALAMLESAAAKCVACGVCEERCPYELPLASLVKPTAENLAAKVRARLGGS